MHLNAPYSTHAKETVASKNLCLFHTFISKINTWRCGDFWSQFYRALILRFTLCRKVIESEWYLLADRRTWARKRRERLSANQLSNDHVSVTDTKSNEPTEQFFVWDRQTDFHVSAKGDPTLAGTAKTTRRRRKIPFSYCSKSQVSPMRRLITYNWDISWLG